MTGFNDFLPQPGEITVFSTAWCGYCKRLMLMLASTDIRVTTVDIEARPEAEDLVKSVNGGNAVVPTVLFSDGSTLTNPGLQDLQTHLAAI